MPDPIDEPMAIMVMSKRERLRLRVGMDSHQKNFTDNTKEPQRDIENTEANIHEIFL